MRGSSAYLYPVIVYIQGIVFIVDGFFLVSQRLQNDSHRGLFSHFHSINTRQLFFQQTGFDRKIIRISHRNFTFQNKTTLNPHGFLYRRQEIRLLQCRRICQAKVGFIDSGSVRIAADRFGRRQWKCIQCHGKRFPFFTVHSLHPVCPFRDMGISVQFIGTAESNPH